MATPGINGTKATSAFGTNKNLKVS